jgi:transposase
MFDAPVKRKTKTKAESQRVQSVWLRAALNLEVEQIAIAVGLSCNTIRCLQSRFRSKGEEALIGIGRGVRRRQNLSIDQEDEVLHYLSGESRHWRHPSSQSYKDAYEQAVGHEVPKPTTYRLLPAMVGVS